MEKTKIIATCIGEDSWCRPVFKTDDGKYYCLVDLPDSFEELEAMVAEANATTGLIHYKGFDREDEPGWPVDTVTLVLPKLVE